MFAVPFFLILLVHYLVIGGVPNQFWQKSGSCNLQEKWVDLQIPSFIYKL